MNNLKEYILEKFKISKDTKVHFFELSDDELVSKMKDIIERYNKMSSNDLTPNIYYDKNGGNNPWRAQLMSNLSYAYPTCAELYAHIVHDYGSEEEYKEVLKWKYNSTKKEWVER